MASGIYRLSFNDEMFYIGQAQDIHARLLQHMDKFRKCCAAQKMQAAYNQYGVPESSILLYCHKDYLDIMETYYINELAQYTSCLNTSIPKLDPAIDYDLLLSNPDLMREGSISFISKTIELTRKSEKLEEVLETLQEEYLDKFIQLRVVEEVRQGRDQNALYAALYPPLEIAYKETQALLIKHQNRNLWKRIFNYD